MNQKSSARGIARPQVKCGHLELLISHSSADNYEAIALKDWLAENGWSEVFLDVDAEAGIMAGERWERALHTAAQRCEAVIFLISKNWLSSGWCGKEYALARGLNKKLFAVIVQPRLSRNPQVCQRKLFVIPFSGLIREVDHDLQISNGRHGRTTGWA